MDYVLYLPVSPELLTTLYFMPGPIDVVVTKTDRILLFTEFAFLRQESDEKQLKNEITLL